LTEFGAVSDDGSVAEVSPKALDRLLRAGSAGAGRDRRGCGRIVRARGLRRGGRRRV